MEKEIAQNAKSNPKIFWKYANSKRKTNTGISELKFKSEEGEERKTTTDKEKAEVLASFFSSVFTIEPEGDLPLMHPIEVKQECIEKTYKESEILKLLQNLDVNKSCGPDGLHPKMLKELSATISKPITTIFNSSMCKGLVPKLWKEGNITALFKKGDKTEPGNYRPVSLTSVICKTMEKLVRETIVKHMSANKLFSNKQFGFISGRSTTLQLLKVMDEWTKILDKGGKIDSVYMDFMKAFDKVPHRRLLHKMHRYKISEKEIKWVESFLNNRTQKVIINGTESNCHHVTSGIPQGSVLGPILFVIYINDMPEMVESSTYLFADDTKIFREIREEKDEKMLQVDLDNLQSWSDTWLLKFHPNKCKVMSVANTSVDKGTKHYHLYNNDGNRIELKQSDGEKDIGVFVDENLFFNKHIQNQVNKANSIMGLIRRTYTYLDEQSFKYLFQALVRPHIEYAEAVWSPFKVGDIEKIENVQRRATKQVPTLKNMEYNERLKKLKMPTLKYRRMRGDMIEVFKIINDIYDPLTTVDMFELNTTSNTRGHSKKMKIKTSRLNVRKYTFVVRIVEIWNSLPESVIQAKTVKNFEIGLDEHWKHQECKYDFTANINIRSNSGSDVKSRINDVDLEADIVATSQRPL